MMCIYYNGKQCSVCDGIPDYFIPDENFMELFNTKAGASILDRLMELHNGPILVGRLGVLQDGVYVEDDACTVSQKAVEGEGQKQLDYFACI